MHALHDRSKACDNFCTLPFYSQFVDVMFDIHSAGSLISREASTVLVKRKNHRSRSECTGGVLLSK